MHGHRNMFNGSMVVAILASALMVLAPGCDDGVPEVGREHGHCYPSGTCNSGLICVSNFCVGSASGCVPECDDGCSCQEGECSCESVWMECIAGTAECWNGDVYCRKGNGEYGNEPILSRKCAYGCHEGECVSAADCLTMTCTSIHEGTEIQPPLTGAPCQADDECETGSCFCGAEPTDECLDMSGWVGSRWVFVGGMCSAITGVEEDICGSGVFLDFGLMVPDSGGIGICTASCDDDSDCRVRDGYGCLRLDGNGYCLPRAFVDEIGCQEYCKPGHCGPNPLCEMGICYCSSGFECVDGTCVVDACVADCYRTECGPDPVCSESCGTCEDGYYCDNGDCVNNM